MFDAFNFSKSEQSNHCVKGFEPYCSEDMVVKAQNLLCTSHLTDEAYLGALAVLMLNQAI